MTSFKLRTEGKNEWRLETYIDSNANNEDIKVELIRRT